MSPAASTTTAGQSGNPAGKPPGIRTAFSQGFIRDFALVWQEEGLEAVRKVARKSPETFVAIAAKVCPSDVRVTLEQQIPGNLSPDDWATMREIVEAVRQAIPDASSKPPGAVLSHVLEALRLAEAKPIDCPEKGRCPDSWPSGTR
jgi:hypothetical protein